jgi:putative SOS response-associated peptidase YedK
LRAYKTINARSETAAEKPMFRNAFRKRRCLMFADSYFEWTVEEGNKQPYRFVVYRGVTIAFAGLWEAHDADKGEVRSCSILTTHPNGLQARYHDRMPVILEDNALELWLTSDEVPVELLQRPLASISSIANERACSESASKQRSE